MKQGFSRALNICVLTTAAVISVGCASSGSLEEVRTMTQEAQKAAEAAQQSADEALSTANAAEQTANQAQSTAEAASQAAQEAQSCCDANTERLDRMFQRAQQK
jgi:methyl-accepting chemotaxis protein